MAAPKTLSPEQRVLRARMGGLATAARHDARSYTEPARQAFNARFEDEVDPDRVLPEAERQRRAAAARRAYMTKLAYASSRARQSRKHAS